MTTPAQGKGKKKNKESTKVSLEEFRSFDAPHGHNVVSIKTTGTGLDWAEAMADQPVTETQQIIVPTAPRAQRGPGIDFDSLPDNDFRVSLYGLAMSVEEKDISERIFSGLDVVRIDITKMCTTVELGSKNDLYEALCKDGSSFKGRTFNVCLYGQQPQNNYASDRYGGGRGGNSSFGDRYGADRDRGFGGPRGGGRFGDRPGGFRDRDSSYGGFNRGGYGQPRVGGGGFGDRYNDRYNDHRHNDRFSDHRPPMDRFSDRASERFHDRPIERSTIDRPIERSSIERSGERFPDRLESEQRKKLDLKKRTTPLNLDDVSRNEAIFGQAKPSSKPYEKLMEIEEKLKGKE